MVSFPCFSVNFIFSEVYNAFLFQRIATWNAYTIERCCQANIPILDVFRMSESKPEGLLDNMHYKDFVFKAAENALLIYLNNIQFNSTMAP